MSKWPKCDVRVNLPGVGGGHDPHPASSPLLLLLYPPDHLDLFAVQTRHGGSGVLLLVAIGRAGVVCRHRSLFL